MDKFKVGDKVRRRADAGSFGSQYEGDVATIRLTKFGVLWFEGDVLYSYNEDNYELVESNGPTIEDMVKRLDAIHTLLGELTSERDKLQSDLREHKLYYMP